MGLERILEAGRRDFLDAVGGIPPHSALTKPDSHGWSILQCVEHVTIFEERYLDWIVNGVPVSARPNSAKELRLFTAIRSRLTKLHTPDALWPTGRFRTLEDAMASFLAARDRSVQVVREHGDSLYSVGAVHPYFGDVNGVELIHLIDGHTRRHADQIREMCEV